MNRLSRSFSLVRSSWFVLSHDKELLLLPVISGVATAMSTLPFLAGALLVGVPTSTGEATSSPLGLALVFLGYLVAAYVTIFFQSALILAANDASPAGPPRWGPRSPPQPAGPARSCRGRSSARRCRWSSVRSRSAVA